MSRHEGVSCDSCLANDFGGKRFKCLICYDYDLCENCHYQKASTQCHSSSHAMQCILTRKDFELYYGGETISPESPPSFVCPFCSKLGFTEVSLQEHVTKEHGDQHTEVVCPVCSSQPSGEPNHVTDDLAHHLSTQHRASRDVDGPIGGRHIRRMLYPGRGMRSRNHRSMHFSNSPIATSAITSSSVVASNNNASSPARELMDPIAELLSQLSGVRRRTQQNGSTASQLNELHSQLQQERQRAAEIRNQLEKFPSKPQSGNGTSQSANVHPSGGVIVASRGAVTSKKLPPSYSDQEDDSRYLLAKLDDINLSDDEQQRRHHEDIDRSHFAQELMLSMLASDRTHYPNDFENNERSKPALESAVAIQCQLSSSTLKSNSADPSSSRDVQLNVPSETASAQYSNQPSYSNRITDDSSSRSVDGPRYFLSDNSTCSPVDVSLSVTDQDQVGDRFGDSAAVSSRSAPALGPEQCALPETAAQWRYHGSINENEKDSDDEKPPSPILQNQPHGLRFQNHVFPSGSVRMAGGLSNPAPIADYGREDVSTGSPSKNVR